jgi:hypothetical protein
VRMQLLSLAFPVIYALPLFNVFGNLAHDWLWWYVPSSGFRLFVADASFAGSRPPSATSGRVSRLS